jgi:hypothetical protein
MFVGDYLKEDQWEWLRAKQMDDNSRNLRKTACKLTSLTTPSEVISGSPKICWRIKYDQILLIFEYLWNVAGRGCITEIEGVDEDAYDFHLWPR